MSTTLQIQDGQILLDPSGLLLSVTGSQKASQDLGECLLQEYLPVQGYGSWLNAVITQQVQDVTELILRQFIADAVNLLQSKQTEDFAITSAELISSIDVLNVVSDSDGNAAYYVKCSTADGGTSASTVVRPANSYNQLFEGF